MDGWDSEEETNAANKDSAGGNEGEGGDGGN